MSEIKETKNLISFISQRSDLMYLQPISLESVFDGGLAAILNLTSRPPEGPQNFPHLKNGDSISIPINMQKLKKCLLKGTIGPFFDTFAVAYVGFRFWWCGSPSGFLESVSAFVVGSV